MGDERHGASGTGVSRPFGPFVMLLHPTLDIGRNARIKALVGAPEDIQSPSTIVLRLHI